MGELIGVCDANGIKIGLLKKLKFDIEFWCVFDENLILTSKFSVTNFKNVSLKFRQQNFGGSYF